MITWVAWGIPWIVQLQALGSWLTPPMRFFTFLGLEQFYVLVMPALLWCVDVGLALRVGMIVLTSSTLVSTIKLIFGLPRPYWISQRVIALSTEASFGMPSGHAMNGLAMWGRIAQAVRRRWAMIAALALTFLISLSRVELGVHFPADVIAGWVFGAALLFLFLKFEPPIAERLVRAGPGSRLVAAAVAPVAITGLALVARAARVARGFPAVWAEAAAAAAPGSAPIDPTGLGSILTIGGIFLGFTVGGALLVGWGGFRAEGPWTQRLARFAVGLAGVVVMFIGLAAVFPSGPSAVAVVLRVIRYALVGFWISYLAPRVFVWVKLA